MHSAFFSLLVLDTLETASYEKKLHGLILFWSRL